MRPKRAIERTGVGLAAMAALAVAGASAPMLSATSAATAARPAGLTVRIKPQIEIPSARPAARPQFGGYTPAQLHAAYFENPLLSKGINGKGATIVIVDSFGSPTIAKDLGVFDRQFQLAAPPSLKIITPAGKVPKFNPNNSTMGSWADETTLDVEWSHAMAPGAKIVLVETPTSENEGTSGFPAILKAEKYVLTHHIGDVISQSFGATEQTFPKGSIRPLRGAYLEAAEPGHDVTVVSASGDAGATDMQTDESKLYTHRVTSWPASDPLVTAVGGLNLDLNSAGQRTAPDQVWNDGAGSASAGGGGLSIDFSRPAFQNGVASVVGGHRGVPDVSMSASCSHAVDIYESFDTAGWELICGTSEATPLLAGVIALADQVAKGPIGPIDGFLYQLAAAHAQGITDVTHGNNTVSFFQDGKEHTVTGWDAVPGYDLASGVGTVDAKWFVPELAAMAKKAGR